LNCSKSFKNQEVTHVNSRSLSEHSNLVSLLAVGGVIAPILYVTFVVVAALSYPGYSHVTQFMSQLGVGPSAAIMNTNSVVTGLLILALAFGLHLSINDGKGSKLGPILLGVSGIAFALAGILPCTESTCTASDVHNSIVAPIALIAGALASLIISRRMKTDARWRSYASYALFTGIVLAVIMPVYAATEYTILKPWVGIAQRILIGVLFLWIEVMGLRLLHLSSQATPAQLGQAARTQSSYEKEAWKFLFVTGAALLLLGLNFVVTGAPGDRVLFQSIAGTTWEGLAGGHPEAAGYISFIYRELGLLFAAYGLSTIVISLTAYRKGEKWAWYVLWAAPLLIAALTALDAAGGAAWWPVQTVFLLIPLVGLILPYRGFFAK
jgi:hypothetical membrane protein